MLSCRHFITRNGESLNIAMVLVGILARFTQTFSRFDFQ
jgi:hypothetical protein